MVFFIDIDETICSTPGDPKTARDYNNAEPWPENIEKANKLYDEGHTIVYWTARGCLTKIDWYDVTKQQLDKWSVKYHELHCDKPFYDMFIDDKALNTRDWE